MSSLEILEALHGTIVRLEARWQPPLPDTSVHHGYDPLPPAEFWPGAKAAIAAAPAGAAFTDLGCGIGTKLAFMAQLGFPTFGVDRHEPYLAVAGELAPEAELELADIRDLDRLEPGLVYCYRPMVHERDELELEAHVVEILPAGSILFLPARPEIRLELEPVAPSVWRK